MRDPIDPIDESINEELDDLIMPEQRDDDLSVSEEKELIILNLVNLASQKSIFDKEKFSDTTEANVALNNFSARIDFYKMLKSLQAPINKAYVTSNENSFVSNFDPSKKLPGIQELLIEEFNVLLEKIDGLKAEGDTKLTVLFLNRISKTIDSGFFCENDKQWKLRRFGDSKGTVNKWRLYLVDENNEQHPSEFPKFSAKILKK